MPIRPENRGRYPANWDEIRERILRRALVDDGHGPIRPQCECRGECGRGTHGEARCPNVHGGFAYGTGSRVVLTVAHLDHTPEHCDPENLRAMCQGCHLHYDRDHHAETRARTARQLREDAGQLRLEDRWAVGVYQRMTVSTARPSAGRDWRAAALAFFERGYR